MRYLSDGNREQRYQCCECNYRFSESIKTTSALNAYNQICALEAKNLAAQTETKQVAGDKKNLDTEGQIIQHLVYLKNNGKRDTTIEQRDWLLHNLVNRGANLIDPESVKHAIAIAEVSESFKALLITAYDGFAKQYGINWIRPDYKQKSPLPFCPHESEIDALINGAGKKLSTLLLTLKETAMRLGEAWQLEWTDFRR